MSIVFLNGEYLEKEDACISPEDRGFLLADGVYEVTPVYGGRFFRLDGHLRRLQRGLAELRIDHPARDLRDVHRRLVEANGLEAAPFAKVYAQITRGVAERSHAFPDEQGDPTVFAAARGWSPPPREEWERGFSAITVPDRRWSRVDIKSIALLPNVLAQQAAVDAGADEAIFVRDGVAIEGAHANLWAARKGAVLTHPATNRILSGITRDAVLELARERGRPVLERAIQVEELREMDEVFLTGSTSEVRPVTRLDGEPVGDGTTGPVARELFRAYRELVGGPEPAG